MRSLCRMMVVMLAAGVALPGLAQDVDTAQKKLLSQRAAQADAYRKLAEAIKGLQITSDTYVKDFVAESDSIRASMDEFIRGVRLGPPKFFEDLSCEVPAEVTVAKVIETLKSIHTREYKGDRVKGTDIEQMNQRIDKKIIKVVGMGAPRPDLPPDLPAGVEGVIEKAPPSLPEPPIPELWRRMPAQARMMAIRAAEIDAKRQLLERIKGLRITSDTIVRDFVAESDQITAQAQGTVVGAQTVRTYLHHDEPIAEVTVEVPLESVITTIKELHTRSIRGDDIKGTDIQEVVSRIQTKTFQATGMGIPPKKYLEVYNTKVTSPQQQIPPWAMSPIRMEGSAVVPPDKAGTAQGKLMAARGAELDAKRKLGEHIRGLEISSKTTVKDFVAEHDEIRSQMDAFLVGAVVEDTRFDGETSTVTVSIPGMQVWEVIGRRIRIVQ
ncbi:MAG TPA: hypothetical protein VLM89_02640 [Phycisphaerae bacterium]|nr:hypothetical protein [Phycisphaerae bacterium]